MPQPSCHIKLITTKWKCTTGLWKDSIGCVRLGNMRVASDGLQVASCSASHWVGDRSNFLRLPLACPSSYSFLLIEGGKRSLNLLSKLSVKFACLAWAWKYSPNEVTWPLDIKVFGTDFLCQCNTWQPLDNNCMLMCSPTVNNVGSVMNSWIEVLVLWLPSAYPPGMEKGALLWGRSGGTVLAILLTGLRVETLSIDGNTIWTVQQVLMTL